MWRLLFLLVRHRPEIYAALIAIEGYKRWRPDLPQNGLSVFEWCLTAAALVSHPRLWACELSERPCVDQNRLNHRSRCRPEAAVGGRFAPVLASN